VQISRHVLLNPNAGMLETRMRNVGETTYEALFGVWKDCNQDGYVGLAESAARDYRVELVDVSDVCPASSAPYAHNDGEWVIELLPIGMVEPCEYEDADGRRLCGNAQSFAPNPAVIYANGTFLWGDLGAPGEEPVGECPTSPPQGTFSGTGAMAKWLDCFASGRLAGAVNEHAPEALRFEDPKNPQSSSSPLNVVFPVSPWGNPYQGGTGLLEQDSGDPAFRVWDCSSPKGGADARDPTGAPGQRGVLSVVNVEDPTPDHSLSGRKDIEGVGCVNLLSDDFDGDGAYELQVNFTDGEGSYAWLPTFAPSVDNPGGSYYDAFDLAQDGLQWGAEGTILARPADCDPATNNTAHLLHVTLESGRPPVDAAGKDRNSFQFTFFDGARGFPPAGSRTPADLGVPYARETSVVRFVGGTWKATAGYSYDPQLVDRAALQPAGAAHVSFYARVDESVVVTGFGFTLPRQGVGIYGAEHCGTSIGPGMPDQKGWVCDPEKWFRAPDGSDATPRYRNVEGRGPGLALGQPVGAEYHLRDIDCHDGTVAPGVRASAADLSEDGPCAPAP
jgi:hypothetical protein